MSVALPAALVEREVTVTLVSDLGETIQEMYDELVLFAGAFNADAIEDGDGRTKIIVSAPRVPG